MPVRRAGRARRDQPHAVLVRGAQRPEGLEPPARLPVRRRVRHRVLAGLARSAPTSSTTRCSSKGYAVATANFNTFQTSCNDVLSAETAMMVKEHVAETIGAAEVHDRRGRVRRRDPAADDRARTTRASSTRSSPVIPFPDAISIAPGVSDCGLLANFYDDARRRLHRPSSGPRSTATARSGTCRALDLVVPRRRSTRPPAATRGSRRSRSSRRRTPTGIRCTLQDLNRNEFGIDPKTGFAHRPLDNVGVQYGLQGGQRRDDHRRPVPRPQRGDRRLRHQRPDRRRARAVDPGRDPPRVRDRSGAVGRRRVRDIPIITVNLYSDPFGDIHDRFRLFTIRERLRQTTARSTATS